jgi:tight adherence protein C
MVQILYFLISFGAFLAVLGVFLFFLLRHEKEQMEKRSNAILNPHMRVLEERENSSEKVLVSFSDIVRTIRVRLGVADSNALRDRLSAAGFYDARTMDIYLGLRVLTPIVFLGAASFLTTGWAVLVGAAAAGYLIPDFMLEKLMKRRRETIRGSLPDTVDLLVICMDAGLGIDQAVQRTAEVLYIAFPALCEELAHLGQLQRMGSTRQQAWRKLVERTKSPDLEQIASMLYQAEQFGTPISDAMRVLADSLRTGRKQRAEEHAAKSGIFLLLPLVVFIFPVIFVVLLGPAAISIIRGFSSFTQ